MLQAFSPGRSPGLFDAVADIAGPGLDCGLAILPRHATSLLIDKNAGGDRGIACAADRMPMRSSASGSD